MPYKCSNHGAIGAEKAHALHTPVKDAHLKRRLKSRQTRMLEQPLEANVQTCESNRNITQFPIHESAGASETLEFKRLPSPHTCAVRANKTRPQNKRL